VNSVKRAGGFKNALHDRTIQLHVACTECPAYSPRLTPFAAERDSMKSHQVKVHAFGVDRMTADLARNSDR